MGKNEDLGSLFEQNKLFFIGKNIHFSISKIIEQLYKQYLPCFSSAKNGFHTFIYNGAYRYSKYNPAKNLETLPSDKRNYLFFESGISLQLFYILKNRNFFGSMKKLIIVYPSETLFIVSWFTIDWKSVLEKCKSILTIIIASLEKTFYLHEHLAEKKKQIPLHLVTSLKGFSDFLSEIVNENDTASLTVNSDTMLLFPPFCNPENMKQIVIIASRIIDSRKKSYITGTYFSLRWKKNARKNYYITNKRNTLKTLPNFDKNIIIWGAGYDVPDYLEHLTEKQKKSIGKDFIQVSIPSTVQLLLKHGITPDFQLSFDGSFFNAFHFENTDIPLISSPSSYFILIKRAIAKHPVYMVSLAIEEEEDFFLKQNKDYATKTLPFYGSSLLTFVRNASVLSDRELEFYLIGTDFYVDTPLTHHRYYPLYEYVRKREGYTITTETWEAKLKIQNKHKFDVYKEALKNLKYKNKHDLINLLLYQ